MSREAVIVAVAGTPIGVAFKGSLNNIRSSTLAAHAISAAVMRAGIDPGEVEDLVMGTVLGAWKGARRNGAACRFLGSFAAWLLRVVRPKPWESARSTRCRVCYSGRA